MKSLHTLVLLVCLSTFVPRPAAAQESTESITEAGAAVARVDRERARGHLAIGVGLAFQAMNIGLTSAQITGELTGTSMWPLQPVTAGVQIGSSIAAPFAIDGFRLTLSDGTRQGDLRGMAAGFLEGGAYALGSAGLLAALNGAHYGVYCQRSVPGVDENGPCWEDASGIVYLIQALPHVIVGGAMLATGGALMGASHRAEGDAFARRPRLRLLPTVAPTRDGVRLGLSGTF